MRRGKTQTLGNISANTWEKIYETTLTEATTSLTISNLDGNTDEEYRLVCRFIGGSSETNYGLRPNNDSGNNYGYQHIRGRDSSVDVARYVENQIYIGHVNQQLQLSQSETILYAKSGYVRTSINKAFYNLDGITVNSILLIGQSWNNTADNITSMVIFGITNALGIGTVIELYRKIKKA